MLAWILSRQKIPVTKDGIRSVEKDVLYEITDATMREVDVIKDTGTPPVRHYHNSAGTTSRTHKMLPHHNTGHKCECTVCGTKLANLKEVGGRYEMGHARSGQRYYMCDDQFCADMICKELGYGKIHTPAILRMKYGHEPVADMKMFSNLTQISELGGTK